MSWKFFIGASILAAALLIKVGAPLIPVALAIVLVGVFNWHRERRTLVKR